MAFAQTGLSLPAFIDKPLQLLGAALSPVALVLVGITLAHTPLARHVRGALGLVVAKNIVMPAILATAGVLLAARTVDRGSVDWTYTVAAVGMVVLGRGVARQVRAKG